MKQAILMSIRPEWLALILIGKKTIEIRKSMPKCELPIDVYLYCTKSKPILAMAKKDGKGIPMIDGWEDAFKDKYDINGKVVAKFALTTRQELKYVKWQIPHEHLHDQIVGNMTFQQIIEYSNGKPIFAWHIDDLVIFDKPKELGEFYKSDYTEAMDYWEWARAGDGGSMIPCPLSAYRLTKAPQSWQYCWVKGETK